MEIPVELRQENDFSSAISTIVRSASCGEVRRSCTPCDIDASFSVDSQGTRLLYAGSPENGEGNKIVHAGCKLYKNDVSGAAT